MNEIETLQLIDQKERDAERLIDVVHYFSTLAKEKQFTDGIDYKTGRKLVKMRLCKICPNMTVRVTRKGRARLAEVRS